MNKKLLITSTIVFFVLSIVFSFFWRQLYANGSGFKGDDIIFCLQVIALLTFLYSILIKVAAKKVFRFFLIFLMPILTCLFPIFLLILIGSAFSLNDYSSLKIYFYLRSIIAITFVLLITRPNSNRKIATK